MLGTHRAACVACAVVFLVTSSGRLGAQATRPAQVADIPVREVVLFSSGVGYFEHFGTVRGDGSAELRFKTEQVNDVLKSLVVQDLDGGSAGTVSYPSQEPLQRTLKSFQVDVTANPSLAELLNQLRGAKLKVTSAGKEISGTILGVEKRSLPPKEGAPPEERHLLNLKSGRKVKVLPVEGVDDFELEDPRLDEELNRALDALAQARDQTKKPVTVNFRGQGERRVRLGYVVETPVWKTSYRLVLSDPKQGAAAQGTEPGRAGPVGAERPGSSPRKDDGVDKSPLPGDGRLQGWAIVENQTDSDWSDVQLSLVSGRPISFIQDLYHPLYVPRPVVVPELYAMLRPQTYEGGITPDEFKRMKERQAAAGEMGDAPAFSLQSTVDDAKRPGGGAGQGLFGNSGEARAERIDPTASVRALASGSDVGELFQYTVGNVSIARQKSAMIPIITDQVGVEKVVVFNEEVLERHPLYGVRLRNSTKNHLLQGPVTVLEAGSYAGDARIENLPPGQERLLTYGVDLQTEVVVERKAELEVVETAKIVDGELEIRRSRIDEVQYVAENKSPADKTLVIESTRPGEDALVEPAKAEEMTDELYRFRRALPAGKAAKFTVRVRVGSDQSVRLLEAKADDLAVYVGAGRIPEAVRRALDGIVGAKRALSEAGRQVEQRTKRLAALTAEQARIRENLKTVASNSEYYSRLVKKLDEQETTIETLQGELAQVQQDAEARRAELEMQVRGLNVE